MILNIIALFILFSMNITQLWPFCVSTAKVYAQKKLNPCLTFKSGKKVFECRNVKCLIFGS